MPMFNEEFLNQLSQEQLAQVIQHQQALIQQHPNSNKKSQSASHLPPRGAGIKRSRSAKRRQEAGPSSLLAASNQGVTENSSRLAARTRAQIYASNIPPPFSGSQSGRRRTSKHSSRNRDQKSKTSGSRSKQGGGRRKKIQPGQGILLNNFFPALESGGGPGSGEKLTAEQE